MIKNENRVSGIGLLFMLLAICFFCVLGGLFFERYMPKTESLILYRIMMFTIMLNVVILFFLIFSFSKIKFIPGPKGPKGIRGRKGFDGKYDTVQKCAKQYKTLGNEYLEKKRKDNIIIQKPVLGFNDKY
jgi:hypothetical protein